MSIWHDMTNDTLENVQVSKTRMFLSDIKHSRNELDQVGFIKEIQNNITSMEEVIIISM